MGLQAEEITYPQARLPGSRLIAEQVFEELVMNILRRNARLQVFDGRPIIAASNEPGKLAAQNFFHNFDREFGSLVALSPTFHPCRRPQASERIAHHEYHPGLGMGCMEPSEILARQYRISGCDFPEYWLAGGISAEQSAVGCLVHAACIEQGPIRVKEVEAFALCMAVMTPAQWQQLARQTAFACFGNILFGTQYG
ncbi:MAG: hypothetical protein ABJI01_10095 [Alteripontixanthobacter sp.]